MVQAHFWRSAGLTSRGPCSGHGRGSSGCTLRQESSHCGEGRLHTGRKLSTPSAKCSSQQEPRAPGRSCGTGVGHEAGGGRVRDAQDCNPELPFSRASWLLTGLEARCHTSHPGAGPFLTCRGAPHPGPAGALRPPAVAPDPSVGLSFACLPPGGRGGQNSLTWCFAVTTLKRILGQISL